MKPVRVIGTGILAGLMACGGSSNGGAGPLAVCTVASGQAVSLNVGQYQTYNPTTGSACYAFPANASATDSAEYLVAPWSAAPAPQESTTFILQNDTRTTPSASIVAQRSPVIAPRPLSIAQRFDAFRLNAARTGNWGKLVDRTPLAVRRQLAASVVAAVDSSPGKCAPLTLNMGCQFVVCDTVTCATRQTISADLLSLGSKLAIFVDRNSPSGGLTVSQLDSVRGVMETSLYALDTTNFGPPTDIDGNGHVMVLMTPLVNALVSTQECNTVGFILGFFFGPDLDPRFNFMFNKGEIYYSLAADPNGDFSCAHPVASIERLTPRTFVHELQHMINYGHHVVGRPLGSPPEEGWLDEGLSTYAEELAGRSFLPDTQLFRRYLAFGDMIDSWYYFTNPPIYSLEIPQDNGTVGEIGASWLFVRYLVDHYGPSVATKLSSSTLFGSANIATQTGVDFPTLVNRWALANYLSDYPGYPTPPELKYTSWNFRASFDTLQQSVLATFDDSVDFNPPWPLIPLIYPGKALTFGGTLRSGTGYYLRVVQAPKDPAFALLFSTPTHTNLSAAQSPRLNVVRMR